MEKKDECTCTPAYWCHDENQMEPSHVCDYCEQQQSSQSVVSFVTSVNKPSSIREDDDDRDDSEAYDDLPF